MPSASNISARKVRVVQRGSTSTAQATKARRPTILKPIASAKADPKGNSKRQSLAELRELQRLAFAAISHPLDGRFNTQKQFRDGRPMHQVAESFIKPNDRLTSFERLAIYNKSYWVRLLDCLWDDYPGLRALLGRRKFEKLRIEYLKRYPSRSFTLRNLGSRLIEFVEREPKLTSPRHGICLDMARFEWAQILAFDNASKTPVSVDDLLGQNPDKLRLDLQPYVILLEMNYPLDDFILAVKKRDAAMRSEASNAMGDEPEEKAQRVSKLPKAEKVFLAVHRHDNDLYYKRLEPPEYQILAALRDGATLADACGQAISAHEEAEVDWPTRIQKWFRAAAEIGWFCKRAK